MEGDVREGREIAPSSKELERQYRLARQTLAMHHALRDSLKRKARAAESVLLVASVVFCATTFAGDDLYQFIGVDTDRSGLVLGLASVSAFAAALLSMVFDWKGDTARHQDAAERWSEVVRLFRESRSEDGTWSDDAATRLSAAYWEASKNTTPIPDKRFNGLKAAYLAKIEVSKTIDKYPGAPGILIWLLVCVRGARNVAQRKHFEVPRRGAEGDEGESESAD